MNKNSIIVTALTIGLSSHLGEVPADLRKARAVTDHHANIAASFSVSGEVDVTDADDRGIDAGALI